MPFYIRKSISAGPFRFNLSKNGVGLSVGVKGLRIGTGPRGHYIHAGRGGLYYRSSIGRAGERRQQGFTPAYADRPGPLAPDYQSSVQMVEIESADVMQMADSRFQTVLDDLNGRAGQFRLGWPCAIGALVIWSLTGWNPIAFPFLLVAGGIGFYLDSYRRSSVVFYDLDGPVHDAYLRLVGAFTTISNCARQWHVSSTGDIRDLNTWKRNAGASQLLKRASISLSFKTPEVLKSNITPPSIPVGGRTLYLLPDTILVFQNGRFGAVAYKDVAVEHGYARFIENGGVPSDAKVVDTTWKFVNKNGGPDRRFKDNRQIPICLYEAMSLVSGSGMNELLQFSRLDISEPFATAIKGIAEALAAEKYIQSVENPH